jgi:hypothetical protein
MLDKTLLASVAQQMMSGNAVEVNGKSLPIRRSSGHHLKMVAFTIDGRQYLAVEQNPEKLSRWGQLAKAGRQVVQFKDMETNRFVAVAVDGEVTAYGGGQSRKR